MIYATGTPSGVPVCMSSFRSVGDGVPNVPSPRQRHDPVRPPACAILDLLSRFPAAGYIPSLFSSHEYGIVMLNIRALSQHNA